MRTHVITLISISLNGWESSALMVICMLIYILKWFFMIECRRNVIMTASNIFFRSTKGEDNCANTYQCPSPSIHVRQVQYLQWTGFFTRQKIQEVYNILKQYVLSRNTLPWISLDIQGFADSAISFDLKEHMFLTDGDNSYTIVFHPKRMKVVIRKNLSSNSKIKVHR